jgi:uncharacterized protein (DUF1919 family)
MEILTKIDVKLREKLNPYLGPLRRRKLLDGKIPFTVISNNCWGGGMFIGILISHTVHLQ